MNNEQLLQSLQELAEAWCDRRNLLALRYLLRGYPLTNALTDGWAELMIALQDVRAFAQRQLTPEELNVVNECIRTVERIIYCR